MSLSVRGDPKEMKPNFWGGAAERAGVALRSREAPDRDLLVFQENLDAWFIPLASRPPWDIRQ